MNFSNDEMNLMCIYDTVHAQGLSKLCRKCGGDWVADEAELRQLTDSTIEKLSAITDDEFATVELLSRFFDDEE